MKFKKQNLYTKDFDTLIEKHFGKDRYEKIKNQAEVRAKVLRAKIDAKKMTIKKQNSQTESFQKHVEALLGKEGKASDYVKAPTDTMADPLEIKK